MFDDIMKLSHKLEDVFFYIRESHPDNLPHLELVDKILAVSDFLREEFDNIKEGGEPTKDSSELIEDLDIFLKKIKNEIVSENKELPEEEGTGVEEDGAEDATPAAEFSPAGPKAQPAK